MNKFHCLSVIFFCIINLACLAQANTSFDSRKLTSYALHGNVKRILDILDSLSNEEVADDIKKLKALYYHRFRIGDDSLEIATTDTMIRRLLTIYHSYWKKALLDNSKRAVYDDHLRADILVFLKDHNFPADSLNWDRQLKTFLQGNLLYAATGRTGAFYDLFLWTSEVPYTHSERLPETPVNTKVIFIENTITMGWEEYATFGKAYPGGWATKELLYCVRKAYDTSSENFKISYLKHEAQHFADYKRYPRLTGADLEYRAKLTELTFASQTLYNLIATFARNANSEGRNAHAFANYAVVRDISAAVLKKDFVTDTGEWKKVAPLQINKAARKLLKQHSRGLRRAGSKTVAELIH